MVLVGVIGRGSSVNTKLLLYALRSSPCFVVDCANAANPHKLFPEILSEEPFFGVQVIQVELIYKFRDVLLRLPDLLKEKGTQRIVITTFGGLFNYNNEQENVRIYVHAWELLKDLAKTYEIIVGVVPGSIHEGLARTYCEVLE